jgi:hypothetical protein
MTRTAGRTPRPFIAGDPMSEPTSEDLRHLHLLGLAHYCVAGMAFLFGLFPILHLTIGLGLMVAPSSMFDSGAPPDFPIRLFGLFFALIPAIMIIMAQVYAVTVALAGRRLKAHSHYGYCQVMAAVSCVFMPFGTVLGILTLLVLQRPAVKELFGHPTE